METCVILVIVCPRMLVRSSLLFKCLRGGSTLLEAGLGSGFVLVALDDVDDPTDDLLRYVERLYRCS